MKKISWAITATAIGFLLLKLFWFSLALFISLMIIRLTAVNIRKKMKKTSKMWQPWGDR